MTFSQVPVSVAPDCFATVTLESASANRQGEAKIVATKTKETVEFVQQQVLKISATSSSHFPAIPKEENQFPLSGVVIGVKQQPDPLKSLRTRSS